MSTPSLLENTAQPSRIRRRAVVAGAAWSVPAITMVTAAPAFAGSTSPWTIASNVGGTLSYRGNADGTRTGTGTHFFNFTITVPAGTTITNPQVVLDLVDAGNGANINVDGGTVNPASVGIWAVSYDVTPNPELITFSTASLAAGTHTLQFQAPNTIGGSDAPNTTPPQAFLTFSSSNAQTGPTTVFGVRAANLPSSTDPNGTFIVTM